MREGFQEFLAIQRAMNWAYHEELCVLKATRDTTAMHKHRDTPGGVTSSSIPCQNESAFLSAATENDKHLSETQGSFELMTCPGVGET